jgi:hypothetical protein
LKALRRAYEKQFAVYKADEKAAVASLKVGASKRDQTLPVVEHAAFSAVCLAILNLDESLTRE